MENQVKKRGRPKLSEEEKAKRAKLREKEKKTDKVKKTSKRLIKNKENKRETVTLTNIIVDEKLKNIVVDENSAEEPLNEDITSNYDQDEEYDENASHLRRYTFVLNEDIRHSFGLKCHNNGYFLPSTIVNELMRMFVNDEVKIRDDYDNYGYVKAGYDNKINIEQK